MRFPLKLNLSMTTYLAKMGWQKREHFPLVLMLEPLHKCNLTCQGCGRIREYGDSMDKVLSTEECLASARDCGAPVVSVSGGEPLLHPSIDEIVAGLLDMGRHVYLCTNGLKLAEFVDRNKPHPHLYLNVHLDGMAERHDALANRQGVFRTATDAIWMAKRRGFSVTTNTTVFKSTQIDELRSLFAFLASLKVDGFLVSPGYQYNGLSDEDFLNREEVFEKFEQVNGLTEQYCFFSTPLYLDFLRGRKQYNCAPWGTVTYNPQGWKAPCYLITDDHYEDYDTFMRSVDWDHYSSGQDPRCSNCMMHSGFEPAVVLDLKGNWKDIWTMFKWNMH